MEKLVATQDQVNAIADQFIKDLIEQMGKDDLSEMVATGKVPNDYCDGNQIICDAVEAGGFPFPDVEDDDIRQSFFDICERVYNRCDEMDDAQPA